MRLQHSTKEKPGRGAPILVAALTAALVSALVWALPSSADPHEPGGPAARPAGAQELGDPEYGVCRGTNPKCYHDWGNFEPAKGVRVLVYSRTGGPRHANLGPVLPAGLNPPLTDANAAQKGILALGAANGFAVDYTEDVTQLASAGGLLKYNAVVFLSTTRDTLDDSAQTALRQYVRAGGGFVGIHNAFGTEYNWPWYEGLLGGTNFYDHGPNQTGTVRTVDRKDSATKNLPATWTYKDEWYNLVPFPSKVRILATVDEKSLSQGVSGNLGHPGHGSNHPVAWCQYYDGGRAFLTTLGHGQTAFDPASTDAGDQNFQKLIVGGILSAAGAQPFCR